MILKAFSVYDIKAESYVQPFFMATVGMAERAFTDAVMDQNSNVGKHPEDYVLYEIGTFNDQTAVLTSLDEDRLVGKAIEFLARAKGEQQELTLN